MAHHSFFLVAQLGQRSSDDGPRIPFGEWFNHVIDWLDINLKWAFDAISWPIDSALELMVNDDGTSVALPRLAVIVALGLLAYVGGGVRRTIYVGVALGVAALMGDMIWAATTRTLWAVVVTIVALAILQAVVLALLDRLPASRYRVRQFLTGWGLIHPHALLLPAIYFFGIGPTTAVIVTVLAVLPSAVAASLEPADIADTASAAVHLGERVRRGARAAVVPVVTILGFLAIVGLGGLPQLMFRSLSNQDPTLMFDAAIAFWLIGFAVWNLLGKWSFDHLPGASPAESLQDEPELAHVGGAVDLQG